jgi:hypothetical protein
VTSEPPTQPGGRGWLSDPSDRRRFIALFGFVLAVVVAGGGWWAWTSYVLSGVQVTMDEAPVCTGTKLRPDGRTIEAQPGMSCVYTVTVRNGGPVAVHLDRSVLPVLGKGGGPVVMAAAVDGREPAEGPNDVDAEIVLDHDLGAGEAWSFRLRVVYRPDGCTSAGRGWVDGWPTLNVDYLGNDEQVQGNFEFAVHNKRQNPDCPM